MIAKEKIVSTIAFPILVEIVIPTVNNKKYIESSNGLFTGCLNLIIDNAPTIPRESAIFPDITVVITNPMSGRTQNVVTFEKVFAQFWPDKIKERLINPPIKIETKHLTIKTGVTPETNKLINLSIIN